MKKTTFRILHLPFFACSFLLSSLNSNGQLADTMAISPQKNNFWHSKTVNILTAPVILFAGSAATWGSREEIRKLRNRYIPTFRHHYDDYMQYVPALAVFGLNAAGIKGKHNMKRTFVSYAFSAVLMGITVNAIKYTAKVQRPSGGDEFNSFPSGHTSNSFMNATFLHKEYGQYRHPLYSVGGYTLATATAIGRQLNNRHWISDVLAGAGIGILTTELGYILADKVFKNRGEHAPLGFNPFPIHSKPSFVEMRIGFANAISKDLTAKSAQLYARRGVNMGIEGAWFFHRNVGFGGEFAFTSFPVNDDNFQLANDPDIAAVSDGHYTQPMGIRYLHIGPFFSYSMPNNWFLTGKFNVGSSLGAEGNISLELKDEYEEDFGSKELPILKYKPEAAFSWTAGIGIQKRIGRNLAVKFYTSYFNSDHDFDVDVLTDVDQNGNYTYQFLEREKVKFDHLAAGFALTAFLW